MTVDYTKLTVNEIKDLIISEGKYNKEELEDVKGKAAWVALHRDGIKTEAKEEAEEPTDTYEWEELTEGLKDIIDEEEEMVVPAVEPPARTMPYYHDPEWNDYVMGQFAPEELVDGKYPNVNSLRRMAELLLGDIVFSGPIKVEQTMDPEHTGKAVVVYKITIDWKLDQYPITMGIDLAAGYPQRSFLSVASCWVGNTDDMFAVFPESIAETRAEGRTLRRALRINVVCADELTKKDTAAIVQQQKESVTTTGEWEESSLITDQQISTIKMMCDRLGINVTKFINSGSQKYKDISGVTRAAAAGMLKQLNRYQSSGDDSIEIPQNLLIGD